MQIPKYIHYCWFGKKPLPPLAIKCINSWKHYLPEYEIKEWNESNFNVNIIPYTKQAYEVKKYAFVSDYARFWILFYYGGIYFDTDVEIISPLYHIIERGPFMGFENNGTHNTNVAPGLGIGSEKGMFIFREILNSYNNDTFIINNGLYNMETVVTRTTRFLMNHGLIKNNNFQTVEKINIYPSDFFCPISTIDGKMYKTGNTVTIHHYAASWVSPTHKLFRKLVLKMFGGKTKQLFGSIYRLFNSIAK